MKEILCIVSGNVQGVLYRRFIQSKAQDLGQTGSARNLDDGTVEVVAQGKEADVRALLESIYSGTDEAEVDNASVQWGPVTEALPDFQIL